jgi:hypothetical protein
MPDWRALVRARLSTLRIRPTTEMDVADEIAQHLEDLFAELRAGGLTDEEAAERAKAEIDSGDFLTDLTDVFPNE